MGDMKYKNATYLGRKLFKEGEKNGKKWKLFKVELEIGDTKRTMSMFGSVKGSDSLVEGEYYSFGYTEEDWSKDGKSGTNRQINFIGEAKEGQPDGVKEEAPPKSSDDHYNSREEDILIGQSINLAVQHLGFTKQELSTTNIAKTAENYRDIILEVKDKLKGKLAGTSKPAPIHPKDDAEIKEVKGFIGSVGGTATIDQLTHKFGEGTVAMLINLQDDFVVSGENVGVKE